MSSPLFPPSKHLRAAVSTCTFSRLQMSTEPSATAQWQHCHRPVAALPPPGGSIATARCTMEERTSANGLVLILRRKHDGFNNGITKDYFYPY